MKKILLISPFPPAQNPRLVKEYTVLKRAGYDVKAMYAERDKWASKQSVDFGPDFILVGGKYGSLLYYITRILHKLLKNILPLAFGYDKVSWLLYLKGLSLSADLYIGHNLASLPIVVKLAKKNNSKCGFDAEDFHRNEVTDDQSKAEYIIPKLLEDKYIEQTHYLTCASPLICQAYQFLYPNLKPITINNTFSIEHLNIQNTSIRKGSQNLKMFWFSQTIGKNRGIETVLEAMGMLKTRMVQLKLLGFITPSNKFYFEQLAKENGLSTEQLEFIQPVSPEEIFEIASQNDIGLALELNFPYNRNICLTNKIFTYVAAGLAIIASETSAQKKFLLQYRHIGKSFPIGKVKMLASIIKEYDNDREFLRQTKINSVQLAKESLNWENESKKFIHILNKL